VDRIHPKKDEADFGVVTQLYSDPVEYVDCGCLRTGLGHLRFG
jgi:hypothetical protein